MRFRLQAQSRQRFFRIVFTGFCTFSAIVSDIAGRTGTAVRLTADEMASRELAAVRHHSWRGGHGVIGVAGADRGTEVRRCYEIRVGVIECLYHQRTVAGSSTEVASRRESERTGRTPGKDITRSHVLEHRKYRPPPGRPEGTRTPQ